MSPDLLVLSSAALAGLLGSAHCAAMCGGIATTFTARTPGAGWLDALEPNLGRVLGYTAAGALAGGIGQSIAAVTAEPVAQALRAAVGLVLVVAALRLLDRSGRFAFLALPAQAGERWLAPLRRRLLPGDGGARRMLAGVLWGWLPCGLSTTVLMAAWLQADALHGAMTMLVFGLGTLPAMTALTWSGARLGLLLQRRGLRTTAGLLVLGAGLATAAAPFLTGLPAVHRVLGALGCRSLA